MEHKMTDVSNELYTALHQPLFEAGEELENITPESPRFVRLYVNKNRSILPKCRDDPQAKVIVLSDIRIQKQAAAQNTPIFNSSFGDINTVLLKARALVVKPIGDRHDMITVGDLDCPNAWIMVACVKSMDISVVVSRRFERGVLAKMRHEIIALDDKLGLEVSAIFAQALALKRDVTGGSLLLPLEATQGARNRNTPDTPSLQHGTTAQIQQVRKRDTDFGPHQSASISKQARPEPLKPATILIPPRLPAATVAPHNVVSPTSAPMELDTIAKLEPSGSPGPIVIHELTPREIQMLQSLKLAAMEMGVPYVRWSSIQSSLTVDTAQGLFKRIYHYRNDDSLVVQNFKEMDSESFEQRVREVACLVKLRGLSGVGQIQSVLDDDQGHLVGLSMTKYSQTLKAFATNPRRPLSACQKLSLILDIVEAITLIHGAGLAHRDLSEVNIMVTEDPVRRLADESPRPWVRVIDFGKSVFVRADDVQRWSIQDKVSEEELRLLPLVVLPPDHGYKLYRSILTLPRSKNDHALLPPVDPRLEDVYSMGILIWRIFSGKSPWDGAIEDDIKTLRYLVSSDSQIKFQIEREVAGRFSRELLLKCLTAESETRSTALGVAQFLGQDGVAAELLREFETLGSGRKKTKKTFD
ncbi:hypothetical protein BG004_004462 [Podila humilis]|nr:hypothetical protein BG004_004462 [Podila humilis]